MLPRAGATASRSSPATGVHASLTSGEKIRFRFNNAQVRRRPEGLLVRHGPEPMDLDEVLGAAAPLPSELLARRRDRRPVDPTTRITMTSGPPSEAADHIPFID